MKLSSTVKRMPPLAHRPVHPSHATLAPIAPPFALPTPSFPTERTHQPPHKAPDEPPR
ncbi:hypothetical protein [Paludibacterium denitrificans]|uniref:Uncharacterized protein n=1 Tax=Paludibacterium denitrificans TaxID=2675226 RepID=A0A844GF51_9NEIS|nr:hypothetical protein [Paludibacterium denitrificans]MTD33334.1 hypothetical protein [Paludibacterium denitrificans]HJV06197.1 hypothetical protein [Chromobacteriaceae bacterium]